MNTMENIKNLLSRFGLAIGARVTQQQIDSTAKALKGSDYRILMKALSKLQLNFDNSTYRQFPSVAKIVEFYKSEKVRLTPSCLPELVEGVLMPDDVRAGISAILGHPINSSSSDK